MRTRQGVQPIPGLALATARGPDQNAGADASPALPQLWTDLQAQQGRRLPAVDYAAQLAAAAMPQAVVQNGQATQVALHPPPAGQAASCTRACQVLLNGGTLQAGERCQARQLLKESDVGMLLVGCKARGHLAAERRGPLCNSDGGGRPRLIAHAPPCRQCASTVSGAAC